MNPVTLVIIALRAAALGVSLSGSSRRGDHLYAIADLVEAGAATDAHMQEVADTLSDRHATDADFDDVLARIMTHRGDLHELHE